MAHKSGITSLKRPMSAHSSSITAAMIGDYGARIGDYGAPELDRGDREG